MSNDQFAEVEHLMLNVTKPPFDNLVAWRAVTKALDRDQFKVASGPFAEGVTGYLADTGLPGSDLAEAKELTAQYESETGRPLEFTITGDNSPGTGLAMSFVQDQMKAADIEVGIEPIEGAQRINIALADDWEVQMWRDWWISVAGWESCRTHAGRSPPMLGFSPPAAPQLSCHNVDSTARTQQGEAQPDEQRTC